MHSGIDVSIQCNCFVSRVAYGRVQTMLSCGISDANRFSSDCPILEIQPVISAYFENRVVDVGTISDICDLVATVFPMLDETVVCQQNHRMANVRGYVWSDAAHVQGDPSEVETSSGAPLAVLNRGHTYQSAEDRNMRPHQYQHTSPRVSDPTTCGACLLLDVQDQSVCR